MKLRNKLGAVACLAASLFVFGCAGSAEKNAIAAQIQDFTLKDLENKEVSLSSVLKVHKAVLINFWATWCPPCREEIPGLINLQKTKGGDAFTVLGVDIGESGKKVSGFVKKYGINYPVLLDADQNVSEKNGIVGIPTSFLVASDGTILGEYHSYSPKLVADVERAVR